MIKGFGGFDKNKEFISTGYIYKEGRLAEINYYWITEVYKKRQLQEIFKYDEFGNMISKSKESFEGGHDYLQTLNIKEVDKYNNWILAEFEYARNQNFEDDEKLTLKRKIEYY